MSDKRLVILVPTEQDMEDEAYRTKYWPNFVFLVKDALRELECDVLVVSPGAKLAESASVTAAQVTKTTAKSAYWRQQVAMLANERDAMQRRAETAEADWQAAEVTIARLTEQRLQDIAIWERRIDDAGAERDACRRNATLAVRRENEALQQRVAMLTEALEKIRDSDFRGAAWCIGVARAVLNQER